MNSYNQFVSVQHHHYNNYSESSDSNTSQQSSPLVIYDYSNENLKQQQQHFKNEKYELNDHEMSDDSTSNLNESILMSKNLNTDSIYKPSVNRGGRKQVKQGTTKRNARERNRVRYINNCFEILRDHIPFEVVDEQKNRKLSKVETLKYATLYIRQLTDLLESSNSVKTNESKEIAFNNININIYDNINNSNHLMNGSHELYSPTSSTSSSSSSSYNGQYLSTGYLDYNDSFNNKKTINYFNYDQQNNWNHHSINHHYNKW